MEFKSPTYLNRVSGDELHIFSRNAQRLVPSVVVAIGDWIETSRKKQVAGFTSLRFTSIFYGVVKVSTDREEYAALIAKYDEQQIEGTIDPTE